MRRLSEYGRKYEYGRKAVKAALEHQSTVFEQKLSDTTHYMLRQIDTISIKSETPKVVVYEAAKVIPGITCDEPLDIVKSIPEFDGKQENYVSWRQAATVAYELFRPYNGSSKHYQAVSIIRNKVRGTANSALSSFSTVLNFDAIIARLDFTYADKTPLRVIQQELATLRQGYMPLLKYYDEIEKKLALLTNNGPNNQSQGQKAGSFKQRHAPPNNQGVEPMEVDS